jgi:hypothetical protein
MRPLLIRSAALLGLTFSLISGAPSTAAAATQPFTVDPNGTVVTATYEGQPIDPLQASHYLCHTRDYPIVRCFASEAEVYRDLGLAEPVATGDPDAISESGAGPVLTDVSPDWDGGAYTIAYWDINYGGTWLMVYGAIPYLGVIGWNDNISSFKSVNCGIPRYYVDADYSGTYWQNSCNTWSPNLYAYNDTFSSVINEA